MFGSWMLSIVGGSILISIFDLILPIGRMYDFAKGIINIVYVYIIIHPLLSWFIGII